MPDTMPTDMQVAEGCYMIGRRNPDSVLQCNTYLRTFHGGGTDFHWCVDPGSMMDYSVIRTNLLHHLGDFAALNLVSMNHQDPDVTGNLLNFTRENPKLTGLIAEDAWRLVRHLNAIPKELWFANKAENRSIRLPGGQRLQMVPTPFCHFRGAVAFYDPESQILFSGDLFGGLNSPGRTHLYAQEDDWAGIAQFHQIYMPTREVVARALRLIRTLDPPVKIIAPQHGFVLTGALMHEFMDRLERLPMGIDMFPDALDERYHNKYAEVFQEIIDEVSRLLGASEVRSILQHLPRDHELADYIRISGDEVRLERNGIRALPLLMDVVAMGQGPAFREMFKDRVLRGCLERSVPLPQMGVGVEETGAEPSGYWLG
jgi:glyoxylase-like metal-dependent hydrolase (beta-lactamase superfamily II)